MYLLYKLLGINNRAPHWLVMTWRIYPLRINIMQFNLYLYNYFNNNYYIIYKFKNI